MQRHVHLMQVARTDVFELQLPAHATREAALALAAGLREALCERLGLEAREIGLAVAYSRGPAGERRVSSFLYDRAAGGAGLVARLVEAETFAQVLAGAAHQLDCGEICERGCSACVLRPDLNLRDIFLDRPGGFALAQNLLGRLVLPERWKVLGPSTRVLGRAVTDLIEHSRRAGRLRALDVFLHGSPGDWDLDGWPLVGVLPRLAEAGIRPRLMLATGAIVDAGFDLAVRLALNRLSASADILHAAELPWVQGLPILAWIEEAHERYAVTAAAKIDAVPGGSWGAGAEQPLLAGPFPHRVKAEPLSVQQLLKDGAGNARLFWLDSTLNGTLVGFGKRFWEHVASKAPIEIAAMRQQGVAHLRYTDRYLLTPLTLGLLAEIINAVPGAEQAQVQVITAAADRYEPTGWAVFHGFSDDTTRQAVLKTLLPQAQINMRPTKSDVPHYRALEATLRDGRLLRLFIDQGMGAWRVDGAPRHDFRAPPSEQARALRKAGAIRITAERVEGSPLSLEMR